MNKAIKFLAITLAALFFVSCADAINPKGNISISLPGNSSMRAAGEKYTQDEVDSYKITVKSEIIDIEKTKSGAPGTTISFENLEPGIYSVTAEAFMETTVIGKSEAISVAVEPGKNTPVKLKISAFDKPEEKDDENPEIIVTPTEPEPEDPVDPKEPDPEEPTPEDPVEGETIISEINIFLNNDFIEYGEAGEFVAAQLSDEKDFLKSAFSVCLVSQDNEEVAYLSLDELDCISVSMPFYTLESTGESVPYVGNVPFTFTFTPSDEGIKFTDPETETEVTYPVKADLEIEDYDVQIKYLITQKSESGDEKNTIKIPSMFGEAEIETYSAEDFYEIPESYFLYPAEGGRPVTVSDTISEVAVDFENNDYLKLDVKDIIEVFPNPNKNEEYTAEIKQTVNVTPSDWAYFEEGDLTCTKTTVIEIIPYTISDVLDESGNPVTTFNTDNVYHVILENEADSDLSQFRTMWYAEEAEQTKTFERRDGENGYYFSLFKLDGETYEIVCEVYAPQSTEDEPIIEIKKEITLSNKDVDISEVLARLKITDKNSEYVFVTEDESYALCTGNSNESNNKTGQILTPDDFEFYTVDADGKEELFEIDNSNNGYRVEIANHNWGVIGKDIPVTITRNYPAQENYTTVTLKRYSKEATISPFKEDESKVSFIVNATDQYPVYYNGYSDVTLPIDYITLKIEIFDSDKKNIKTIPIQSNEESDFIYKESNGANKTEETQTASNKLDVVIDFAKLGIAPGNYILEVTSLTVMEGYEGLFLPSTITSEITVSESSSNETVKEEQITQTGN